MASGTMKSFSPKLAVFETASSEISIPADDRGVFSIPIAKTGYTPIGIIGITTANNWTFLGSFTLYGNDVQVVIHNRTTYAQNQTVTVAVLYLKND